MKRVIFLLLGLMAGCAAPKATVAPVKPVAESTPPVTKSVQTNQWTSNWKDLFDGKSLRNWAVTDFAGQGGVLVESNQVTIQFGAELSGITWTNGSLPKSGYEISLDAIKITGNDFFCGLTFPVGDSSCSLIVGGWGGGVVGLSCIDGLDASENETTKNRYLEAGKWFSVRVRVTDKKIEAWLGEEKIVEQILDGHKISLRIGEIYRSEPLGIATFQTTAGIKNIRLRLVHD